MERLSPSAAGRPSPTAAIEPYGARDPSPLRDAEIQVQEEDGPSDGSRLLACLQVWALHRDGRVRLHYRMRSSGSPGALPDAAQLHERLQDLAPPLPAAWHEALLQGWPLPLHGLHRIELVPGAVWVSIAIGLKPSLQRRLDAQWRARPQARPNLAGPAAANPRHASPPRPLPRSESHADEQKTAVIVGAGLAGCAMADALARRGWRVTVLERSERIGGAVAGIPLLAQHPALSPGEDRRSRLLVAALLASRRLAGRLGDAMHWCGRFQPMPLAEARMRTAGVPPSIAQPVGHSHPGVHGVDGWQGIWYPGCAMAHPQRWWQRLLQDPAVELHLSRSVAAVRGSGGRWQALGHDGEVIASAAVLILANQAQAFALAELPDAARGRLRHSWIQVAVGTAAEDGAKEGLKNEAELAERGAVSRPRILGGIRYLLEDPGRHCVIGPLRPGEDRARAHLQLDGTADITPPGLTTDDAAYRWQLSEPAERLLLRDNLPMIGAAPDAAAIMASARQYARNDRLPLPRRQSLHLLTGLGGRGLLWSVLGAEMIAAAVNREPPVVEPDLQDAVDPARFLRRSLRRAAAGQAEGTKLLSS